MLPEKGYTRHSKFSGSNGHWLVIDTNIVLHQVSCRNALQTDRQMDLLAALPPQLPIIVPSTVIRETRHRSLPLFNRLQQLVQEEDRCIWVWWNEECRDTATVGIEEEGESINDRNDRGELVYVCQRTSSNIQRSAKPSTTTLNIFRALRTTSRNLFC